MSTVSRQEVLATPRARSPWRGRHILDLDDFTRADIVQVMETADAMKEVLGREIRRLPTLRGKTVITLFYEASTRTRISFELAAKNLGADVCSLAAQTSSVTKGESLADTARTLQAMGADAIIMRHPQSGAPYLVAQQVDACVINAGDGWHAHPTQALLDLYTIRERLGGIDGRKVTIIGDILHSRVARSDLWGLTTMGAKVTLCGPPTLRLAAPRSPFSPDFEERYLPVFTEEGNLDRALPGADVVMVLRLQLERQKSGLFPSIREYVKYYQLDAERLRKARPNALVMHPGPMNEGIEIAPDVAHGSQSVVEEQVTNGVAVRMALLYLVMGGAR
ncbi:MAG: aspartate carbamoyltransferase catalytic subunit [Chloroflexi bacterium]|nr:aspartate carbamoyltransferase catalytic subunit [Chloroflexota bacterium]